MPETTIVTASRVIFNITHHEVLLARNSYSIPYSCVSKFNMAIEHYRTRKVFAEPLLKFLYTS
jgi:hypothetical protein